MLRLFNWTCAILLLTPLTTSRDVVDGTINAARERIIATSQTLLRDTLPTKTTLRELQSLLRRIEYFREDSLPTTLTKDENWKSQLEQLDWALAFFDTVYAQNPKPDTLRTIFRLFSSSFEMVFSDYFLERALGSEVKKIISFNTSVSCECTLKMCADYIDALYALKQEFKDRIEVVVVDAFSRPELKERYKVTFLPTVIVLDGGNKETHRFVREEGLTLKLKKVIG
jgi:hypothetical protein